MSRNPFHQWMSTWMWRLNRLGLVLRWRQLMFFELIPQGETSPPNDSPVRLEGGIRITDIPVQDLREDMIFGWIDYATALQSLRMKRQRFFLARLANEPVASCWTGWGSLDLTFFEAQLVLPSDAVYIEHLIVKPKARGNDLAKSLLEAACRGASTQGFSKFIIACDPANSAVQSVFRKTGSRNVCLAFYARFIWLRIYRIAWPDRKAKWLFSCSANPILDWSK